MDIHQFPRVKDLSSPWRHRLEESQVCSISFILHTCVLHTCICLVVPGNMQHSNCIVCRECNKGTINKSMDRMQGKHKRSYIALGLAAQDAFIICSLQAEEEATLREMEKERCEEKAVCQEFPPVVKVAASPQQRHREEAEDFPCSCPLISC